MPNLYYTIKVVFEVLQLYTGSPINNKHEYERDEEGAGCRVEHVTEFVVCHAALVKLDPGLVVENQA